MSTRVWVLAALAFILGILTLIPLKQDREDTPVFTLPALGDLNQIEVSRTGWKTVQLVKNKDEWRVGSSPITEFAQTKLDELITPIQADKTVALSPDEYPRFGVTDDALTLVLHHHNQTETIRVGKVVDGRNTFIRRLTEPGLVYRMRGNLRRIFERKPAHWPERHLFSTSAQEFAQISRARNGQIEWTVVREGPDKNWRMLVPAGLPAGENELQRFSYALSKLQASERLESPDFKPDVQLKVTTFSGQTLGLEYRREPNGDAHARRIGESQVFQIKKTQIHFLDLRVHELLEQRLFPIDPQTAQDIKIEASTQILHLKKQDETHWSLVTPQAKSLSFEQISPYISGILNAKSAGLAPNTPADAFNHIEHRVSVRTVDDQEYILEIGAKFRGESRFARVAHQPKINYVLNASTLTALRPSLEDLTSLPPNQ